ncbi:ATP-binding cassette domain-containing protein [Streptomyces chattanoogensis]|uniref:ABC transporter ATP-binding protein n=1 Tax=Streptomyces chattanoogensis TaxID=66876 RepID=A0A0N0XWQ3_9ACTN|nr:ABC transporter ATP-binding protein [Streptomyces chattanoogensis]KPC61807.1 ABC transporter ATP-binding protein [Streptomyces chattanoogensis]
MTAATIRLLPRALRFLRARTQVLLLLGGWSLLESAHTFVSGYGVAKALDDGFLAGHTGTGLGWLAVAAAAIVISGAAGRGVFRGLADLVEPLRDVLVRTVVTRALGQAVADPARAVDTAVVSRLTNQTELARDSFAGLVLVARSFVFTAAGALLGLVSLAPQLLLIVLPPLIAGLLLFLATLAPMARHQRAFLRADETLSAHFGAVAAGLRDIAACGARPTVAARAYGLIEAEARAARRLAGWAAARCLALGVAGQLPVLLLLLSAPWLLRQHLTAGTVLGALTYLTQALLPALHTLMNALGSAGTRLLVVLDRLTGGRRRAPLDGGSVEDAHAHDASRSVPAPVPVAVPVAVPVSVSVPALISRSVNSSAGTADSVSGQADSASGSDASLSQADTATHPTGPRVELRSITFAYGPGAQPVLHDLDLVVEPGEHLAVVGPSGIGKSTLAGLLAGLLAPTAGAVRVNGRPPTVHASDPHTGPGLVPDPDPDPDPDPSRLRVLIPQQAYVFSGSVRDNLLYLCPDGACDAAVAAASHAVGLSSLVSRLGGLDARIDPAALSQGERQLIALGRAHLSPAPLLLLDEATCHLDPAAEQRAEQAFADRPGTLIVIAHRITSAQRADRVLVMDGIRATVGSHTELLGRSALYRELAGNWQPESGERSR